MVRFRFFAFLAMAAAVLAVHATARAEPGDELVGTWEGGSADLKETWTISREKDAWAVTGVFTSKNGEVGSFKGTNVTLDKNTLKFRQEYVKRIRERRVSRGRTVFAIAGVLGAVVGLAAGTNLAGFGNGGDDRAGSGVGEGQ